MTEAEVGSLFEHVKRYLPSFHTEDFMTDDTNTFWKGYNKRDLFEPFFRKMKEICLVRNRNVFVAKYTLILGYLRKNEESVLSSYMENSWSDRVDQWAAFGWLGSCVNTSMLCERFHKTPKHEMLEGKANVRADRLLQLLIALTTELEEKREIMIGTLSKTFLFHRLHAISFRRKAG
ncbi:hypothetical protein RB195_024654 [Necator americanus]|uniref:Uncharacterized protein n=1 Tax=Necator americanus TaxID=51031 RepID=A0ABR1EP63_NECAM